jgi:hypothetical protein
MEGIHTFQFQDILSGPTVFILNDLEDLAFGPEVEAVFMADHEGVFHGLTVLFEGLFGLTGFTIAHIKLVAIGTSLSGVGESSLAIAAGWVNFNHMKALRLVKRW